MHCREILWTLLLLAAVLPLQAAELALQGNRLFVSGTLDGSALQAFKDHLASGRVRTVVFENSVGGSAEVASDFARAIRSGGFNTEAHGQCHAACAYAFLAGKEHRFGRGFQVNALLIPIGSRPTAEDLLTRWHGEDAHRTVTDFTVQPRSSSNEAAPQITQASLATGAESTPTAAADARGEPGPMGVARERWHPDHGVLFTSTPTLFGRVYNTLYCDGSQGRDTSRCEILSNADPYKLGVLSP